jgi:fatty-acyl-CoA synthase/fatty acid CoA ligase FadD22
MIRPATTGPAVTAPNLAAELETLAARHGWTDRPAVHTAAGTWTHGEVHDLAARAATVLRRDGIGPGSRVLIALPDDIGWMAAFLACARTGATAVPVNPALPADDHAFMADDCAATLAITTPDLAARFADTAVLDVADLLSRAADATSAEPVTTDEPLYVHYTSGTTGTPKGVVHRQGNPAVYHRTIGDGCLGITPDDVTLSISKLYFTYGFCNSFVFPLYSGSSVVLATERLGPRAAADLVARHGVTRLYAVPSWYARMLLDAEPAPFTTVRAAVAGGERLTRELADDAAEFLGAPVLNQLGATEIGCAGTANSLRYNVNGTIGREVPEFSVRVADDNGNPVPDGTEGDLWVRGPVLMAGYLNRPDATAEVLVDGWLLTRDRVVRNEDGTYTHVRRADDMEMVGGITMSPLEVEDLLGSHDDVREVAVAAVPDASGATKLRAFVVPTDLPVDAAPDQGADRLAAELIELARGRLAAFKVPRSVHLVSDLPRTSSGKLRRYSLRQRTVTP